MDSARINLAAHTAPGSLFPAYVSINYENTMVEITVRSPVTEDGREGATATIRLNLFDLHKLCEEAQRSAYNSPLLDQADESYRQRAILEASGSTP